MMNIQNCLYKQGEHVWQHHLTQHIVHSGGRLRVNKAAITGYGMDETTKAQTGRERFLLCAMIENTASDHSLDLRSLLSHYQPHCARNMTLLTLL